VEVFRAAASLMVKSVVLSGQWAGQKRLLCLRHAGAGVGDAAELRAELVMVRDENRRLRDANRLLKSRLHQISRKQRYTPMQRLQILWHMAYYRIPRKRVKEHFCIARSTLYLFTAGCTRQRRARSARRNPVRRAQGRLLHSWQS